MSNREENSNEVFEWIRSVLRPFRTRDGCYEVKAYRRKKPRRKKR